MLNYALIVSHKEFDKSSSAVVQLAMHSVITLLNMLLSSVVVSQNGLSDLAFFFCLLFQQFHFILKYDHKTWLLALTVYHISNIRNRWPEFGCLVFFWQNAIKHIRISKDSLRSRNNVLAHQSMQGHNGGWSLSQLHTLHRSNHVQPFIYKQQL